MDPSLIFLSLAFLLPLAAALPPRHLTTHRRISAGEVEDDVRPCDSSTCAILALFFYLLFGIAGHQKTNISHLLFGIAGSAKSWILRRHFTDLWWDPATTRGFFWLDQYPKHPHRNLIPITKSPSYKVSADTSKFNYTCRYGSRSTVRIARIIKESFDLGITNVRWFIMGDDDTVFFPENLVTVLNKYDHREMYYVGTNSESVEQVSVHSYNTTYGGAGFTTSYPLAATLVTVLDGCIDRYAELYDSDNKISQCMNWTIYVQY